MLSKVISSTVYGINGYLVNIEVDIASGMPRLTIVGLPDTSVREAKDRVVAAIQNSGFEFPWRRLTVNLAPADLKKEGSLFDLAIATGILAANGRLSQKHLQDWCLIGELALDGKLRPVKGILPIVIEAKTQKLKGVILPIQNVPEAQVVEGIHILGIQTLKEVTEFLSQEVVSLPAAIPPSEIPKECQKNDLDFADVKGQKFAKRALEIACAGGHNLLMIGPPGSGKTMLSKRMTTILPAPTFEEAIETTKIHSVAGLHGRTIGLIQSRPFRNPHHTISDIALIGGGSFPRPGEVSLAHNGVLFLDELPEFHREALEALRQPLESREAVISRAKESLTFPANFMLIAAMNPCPCGFFTHPTKECVCTPHQINKYMAKISGPLLDRIDMHLELPVLTIEELTIDQKSVETSSQIRQRVVEARLIQRKRFAGTKIYSNAQMHSKQTKKHCALNQEGQTMIRTAIEKLHFSARAYDRILKVARTIADLAESETIHADHIAEAIQYRSLDKMKN